MATPTVGSNNPRHPWLIARDRFVAELDPAEQAIFNEATPENLFYKTSNIQQADQKNSKTRAIIQSLAPLTKAIQDYGTAMDAFANIAPLYISPIWGSIRVVLVLANKYGTFYDRIIGTFARIGDILPRLSDYEGIFDQQVYPELTQKISAAYLDIIVLCFEFRKLLLSQKVSLRSRIFKPLSTSLGTQLDEAVANFQIHRKDIDKQADVCHMLEAKKCRDLVLMNEARRAERKKEAGQTALLARLSAIDYQHKHRRMQEIRLPGSGEWIANLPEFVKWRACNTAAIISCYGIPGSGKSVLMSKIIDGTQSINGGYPAHTVVAYYYCDYADKRTLSLIGLCSCISQQLMRNMSVVSSALIHNLDNMFQYPTSTPTLEQVSNLLISVINECNVVAIFVDGLDEMPEIDRKLTFSTLTNILKTVFVPMKLFVSSREDTSYLFQNLPSVSVFKFHIQMNLLGPDIDAYIRDSIKQLRDTHELELGDPSLEEDIFEALHVGARGMFLWVKFQFDELCRLDTDASIINALQNLPRNLEETYDRLLGRIIEIERREFVKRMFDWIICSCRPLHMDELRDAIAFTADDKSWDATKIPNDIQRLIRACGNLILIDEDTLEVHLAHYTVEQYILHSRDSTLAYFHTTKDESNRALGATCITYLSFTDFEAQVTVYRDTVNSNMAALREAVTTQSLIPIIPSSSNLPAKAAKATLSFRKFRHDNHNNIDYAQYIQIPRQGMTDQEFLDKYRLITYLKENWFSHTKDFTKEICQSNTGELFRNLLFNKQLPFSIKPWEKLRSRDCARIVSLGWALAENHLPLLNEILAHNRSNFAYIGEACLLFWRTVPYCPTGKESRQGIDISDEVLKVLAYRPLEDLSSRTDCLFWLYSQIISACRQGNDRVMDICLELIDEKAMPAFSGTDTWCNRQPTLRSLVFSHLHFEATIQGQLILAQKIQATDQLYLWVAHEHKGSYFNVLERAITLPHDQITDYLLMQDCPVSNKAKLDAMKTLDIRSVVESGDLTILKRLMKFLEKYDGSDANNSDTPHQSFGNEDHHYKEKVWKYKLDAIRTAASLGLRDSLHLILAWESTDLEVNLIAERSTAFLAAVSYSHLHVIEYLLFTDRYKDRCYWLQPIPPKVYPAQSLHPFSLMQYAIDERFEISEELREKVVDTILDASEDSDTISCEYIKEIPQSIIMRAIIRNKPKMVILLGGRDQCSNRIASHGLPDFPREIEEYLWPYGSEHEEYNTAVPLIWAVIYNRPQVVEVLLSEGFPREDYDTLTTAATCAIMMDSVELVMLLEEVQIFDSHHPTILDWGQECNFFIESDLIDYALARGRYQNSTPSLKVAQYIESWILWHWRSRTPNSTEILRDNLRNATPANKNTISADDAFGLSGITKVK